MKKTLFRKRGQILVETIIGVGVIGLVLVAIIPLFLIGIKAGAESWRSETARFLATGTFEQAKALKTENWNNLYRPLGTNDKGAANPYHLEENAGKWELAVGAEDISLSGMTFSRQITIDNVSRTGVNGAGELETSYTASRNDPSTQKITARVSWENSAMEMIDYFGRSKNSLWQQTDWSGGQYFSQTQIDSTSAPGALKLATIPGGGTAHYGNEFILNSTTTIYRLNNPSYRVSMRFTAQESGQASQLRIYIAAEQRGNTVFYRYGLQGDSGGNPSGSYLSSEIANFSSTGWQTINLTSPTAITAGNAYHLVIQYDSGSPPASNRYIDIRSSLPNNLLIPESGANDINANTLGYYGTPISWHVRNQQPLYVLGFDDSTFEGNPYDTSASRNIYGTRLEGETFTLTTERTVSGVGLYVASSRDPLSQPAADNLYVTLLDLTDGVTLVNAETFVDPLGLTTSFQWLDHNFASTQTLPADHQFRLYFSSPGSGSNRNYLILNESNPNTAEYNGLNWDGTGSVATRSTDSGASFTDYNYIDLSYYLIINASEVYAPWGELISLSLDTTNPSGGGFNRISWAIVGALPPNTTVKMQLGANNDQATWNFTGPAGTTTDWYTLSTGENIWTDLYSSDAGQAARYLRYKIRLETTDNTVTPTVDWVRINWSY